MALHWQYRMLSLQLALAHLAMHLAHHPACAAFATIARAPSPCSAHTCLNGGTCVAIAHGSSSPAQSRRMQKLVTHVCRCTSTFTGSSCAKRIATGALRVGSSSYTVSGAGNASADGTYAATKSTTSWVCAATGMQLFQFQGTWF